MDVHGCEVLCVGVDNVWANSDARGSLIVWDMPLHVWKPPLSSVCTRPRTVSESTQASPEGSTSLLAAGSRVTNSASLHSSWLPLRALTWIHTVVGGKGPGGDLRVGSLIETGSKSCAGEEDDLTRLLFPTLVYPTTAT